MFYRVRAHWSGTLEDVIEADTPLGARAKLSQTLDEQKMFAHTNSVEVFAYEENGIAVAPEPATTSGQGR